ncbi:MAG: ABC transporter permease [Verrucomicrobiota bacterium]
MRGLASFFRRRQREQERELEKELRFHLEEQIRANLAQGMSADEARRAAALEFGGLEQIKEECRDERRWLWLEQLGQDLRYALRQVRRSPWFSTVVVLTLALGIGASTAIFSVVNSVLLRPIPYPNSERIVAVRETRTAGRSNLPVSPANYHAWSRESEEVFEAIYAERVSGFNLTGVGEPRLVRAAADTDRYFATLGVQPAHGRAFVAEEYESGKDRVVILNHGFWQRQLGGRPEAVGETLRLDGKPYTIVGIMPADFQRDGGKELLLPLAFTPKSAEQADANYLSVFARLKPGVTVEQAGARLAAVARERAEKFPATNRDRGVSVVSILENRTNDSRPLLFTLAGAVMVLLLIACTNVANLLLVRGAAREKEMSVRIALGATRGRIIRQLLVESLLLSLSGAVLGLGVAKVGLKLLLARLPNALPRPPFEIVLDERAVVVALGLAVITGLGFGLVPALQGSRSRRLGAPMPAETGGVLGRAKRHLARHGFVIAEIGLALLLLSGAGLLVRSFARIAAFDPGFNPKGALVVGVPMPREKYEAPGKRLAFMDAVAERFRALPGVSAVGITQSLPLSAEGVIGLEIEGRDVPASGLAVARPFVVSPEYFGAAEISLLAGRGFAATDRAGAVPVAIVSQSAAAEFFPGIDPLGQRVKLGRGPAAWREIVGVVADVKPYGVERETTPQIYTTFAQTPSLGAYFIVRAGDSMRAEVLRQEVYAVDPDQPVMVERFTALLMRSFARQEFAMMLFAVFSGMALLFAAVGIYSVVAFSVARRTSEFGIRIALGARPVDLFRFVLSEAGKIAACGIAFGVLCTLAVGRVTQAYLDGATVSDPLMFATIAALLFAVALTASLVPARRAMKIDPLHVLRAE